MSKKNKSRRSVRRTVWIVLILVILGGGGYYGYYKWYVPAHTTTTAATQTMQTATARQGNLVLYATGTGTLVPAAQATFGFDTSGQVIAINVKVGDKVQAGDVLADIDPTSAKAALQDAQRALNELISPSAIASAQQAIATDQLSVTDTRDALSLLISPEVLNWEEKLATAQQALDDAKAGGDSTQVTTAENAVKTAQANLDYANSIYPSYVENTFAETTTDPRTGDKKIVWYYDSNGNRYKNIMAPSDLDISQARADYELAKATLQEDQWYLAALQGQDVPDNATGTQLSALQNAQDAVTNAEDNVKATQLIAPISGTVMSLDINVGDQVGTSTIATIADLSTPYIEIYLDSSDWGNIAVGYPTEVTFDALPDKTFTGKVTSVDPALVSQGGTYLVHGMVQLDPNQSLDLPTGMTAAVDVIGGRAENVVLVPVEALREISPGQYAVFVMENGAPVMRTVEVGLQDQISAEIKSGLKAGDVVTTGIVETGQ